MKVVCCGSRGWTNGDLILRRLQALQAEHGHVEVLHGGARGADLFAAGIARGFGMQVHAFPADWKTHGKRAGIIRNLQMLDENPALILAFWDGESPGTRHMVSAAQERGIPVEVIRQ